MLMFLMCSFIGGLSALNSSSRKGPMFVSVEDNSSALQSCTVTSMKPTDSARAECRAADGPISVRMQTTGVLLLPCFSAGLGGAIKSRNKGKNLTVHHQTATTLNIAKEHCCYTQEPKYILNRVVKHSSCWSDLPDLKLCQIQSYLHTSCLITVCVLKSVST